MARQPSLPPLQEANTRDVLTFRFSGIALSPGRPAVVGKADVVFKILSFHPGRI
jgi:hypothetical protein